MIPAPVSRTDRSGFFTLGPQSAIDAIGAARTVGEYLAGMLRPATGFELAVGGGGDIRLTIGTGHRPGGYTLDVEAGGVAIEADDAASLFAAVQSLRQLLPVEIESRVPVAVPWVIPSVRIEDYPRFAYRGAMLDVARHFLGVDDVKRFIDDIALLKLNYLHLHLTDDQGWRLHIDSWPLLTEVGGLTQVGGGGGGYAVPLHYTKADYREIVEHAASRFVTVVPEIDMPGHTNAALNAYPELNDDGIAPPAYEGIEVGFSSLAISNERTYALIDDVIRELVELTPGPYIHLGGDESLATTDADFLRFIARATSIAARHGKTIIGWHEMGRSPELPAGTIGQYWSFLTPRDDAAERTVSFVKQGGRVIMSPADVTYLDHKYDEHTELGLVWANGPTSVRDTYGWDPAAIVSGVGEEELLGVEAAVWTETISTIEQLETMFFPRAASIAEIGWSPVGASASTSAGPDSWADSWAESWADFEPRLVQLGARLDAAGILFHRAPEIPWR